MSGTAQVFSFLVGSRRVTSIRSAWLIGHAKYGLSFRYEAGDSIPLKGLQGYLVSTQIEAIGLDGGKKSCTFAIVQQRWIVAARTRPT